MTTIEEYLVPRSLEELTRATAAGSATVLAGGTDLMPQTQSGARPFRRRLVNVRHVAELQGIAESGGRIRIGARTTITEVLDNSLLRDTAGVLVQAADQFASSQVRNVATLGGNICNASPAADIVIPLLLLDAEVELASWANEGPTRRTLPLCEFFVGPGKTRALDGEVLTTIRFPVPRPGTVAVFKKLGARPALDIAVVSVGVSGVRENGCLRNVRAAFGAVAPTPIRGWKTEAALEGRGLDPDGMASIVEAVDRDIAPISDVRASAWYRRRVLGRLTERILRHVAHTED